MVDRHRRAFLQAAGLSSLFLKIGGVAEAAPVGASFSGDFLALFSDLDAPYEIGRLYLEDHPEEADPHWLANLMFGGWRSRTTDALRADLARLRQQDFRAGDTVIVQRWVLARSEARACALACMLAGAANA